MFSFLVVLTLSISQIQPWVPLQVESGKFTLEAPGKMEMTSQLIETDLGSIEYISHHLTIKDDSTGSFTFLISYYPIAEGVIPLADKPLLDEFLDATVSESAMAVNGEIIFEDEITYQGTYPGRFWRMHFDDGTKVMKSKAFLTKDTFYSLQVAVDEKHSLSPVIDRFFDSFKVIEE